MSTITEIEINHGAVCLYLDGAPCIRIKKVYFDQYPLNVGDEPDMETWEGRIAQAQFNDAWEAALNSLDRAAQTEQGLRRSLKRRGYVPQAIDAVIARLREMNLINDAAYARRMAELQSQKPVGLYAFRRRLMTKGISEEDATQALETFDDEQQQAACLQAAQKLIRKYADLPQRESKAKLSQALARRGFSWSAIEGALDILFE